MHNQSSRKPFYGSTILSRDFGQFVVTERRYPAGFTTPVHAHERPLFVVVLEGGYEEQRANKRLYCTPATTLFHVAEEEHLERFADCGGRSLVVELEPPWLGRIREISRASMHNSSAQDGGMLRPLGSRLYREFLTGDPASQLMIEGLLLEIAGAFFRAEHRRETRRPQWLARAVEIIQDNFPRRLTLASIADQVRVHPVHLAQSFRRFHGCTIGEYVRRIRLDYACEQLTRSDKPFIDIASAAGFADRSHFTRTFKRTMGISPCEYRAATLQRSITKEE